MLGVGEGKEVVQIPKVNLMFDTSFKMLSFRKMFDP